MGLASVKATLGNVRPSSGSTQRAQVLWALPRRRRVRLSCRDSTTSRRKERIMKYLNVGSGAKKGPKDGSASDTRWAAEVPFPLSGEPRVLWGLPASCAAYPAFLF